MRVLKILGIVFGTLLLVTGFVLAGGWQAANVAKAETAEEWANSGYAGPVDATVQSVDQAKPGDRHSHLYRHAGQYPYRQRRSHQ